jgi:hypothetical protein
VLTSAEREIKKCVEVLIAVAWNVMLVKAAEFELPLVSTELQYVHMRWSKTAGNCQQRVEGAVAGYQCIHDK